MAVTATNTFDAAALNAQAGVKTTSTSASAGSAQEISDRFMTLLVTQMKNQDPLNPMDNAQITTQMAQISTVSGIDKLSASVDGMSGLLLQTQSLEGAMLVGKDVLVQGNQLSLDASGNTGGGFALEGAAKSVAITIKDAAGKVVDTLTLDNMSAGRHTFDWTSPDKNATGLRFEVSARNGTETVGTTPLVIDRVAAVYMDAGQLSVALARNGTVKYSNVLGVS